MTVKHPEAILIADLSRTQDGAFRVHGLHGRECRWAEHREYGCNESLLATWPLWCLYEPLSQHDNGNWELRDSLLTIRYALTSLKDLNTNPHTYRRARRRGRDFPVGL